MTPETKRLVLDALHTYLGDDHIRARMAFGNLPSDQLDIEHGQSGRTRRQLWDAYEAHATKVAAAIREVEGI